MIDVACSGFDEGMLSWITTADGVHLLFSDMTNPELTVSIKISRENLVKLVRLSRVAAHVQGEMNGPE